MDKEFNDFLIKAKRSTYANSNIEKEKSSRLGSNDYHYEEVIDGKKYIYHDTYFGGTKFIGEEVVYINNNIPIWGMNYYGVTIDSDMSEEAMDMALRPALMQVGGSGDIIPVRGPKEFKNGEYTYKFEVSGTIDNFLGIERIYKNHKLIYELHCSGGVVE